MVWEILFYLFIVVGTINVLHFGLYMVGANYYDIRRFKTDARTTKLQKKRTRRPLVSVLIPAHNEEKSIIRCLESVRKNTHRKVEIIVIDDASSDNTRKLVREYIALHPNRNIKLLYKRKNVGKAEALNHALKRAAHGDLIMTLDADSVIDRKTIKHAVAYFDDPAIAGVAANVRVLDNKTILGLLQKFEYMVGYRSKKFFSVTNSEFIVGGVASTYRASVLKKVGFYDNDILTEDIALSLKVVAEGNKAHRIVYGYDVIAMTEGVQTFKSLLRQRYRWKMGNLQSIIKYRQLVAHTSGMYSRMLTWYRLPMAFIGEVILLFEPLVLAFVIYACLQLGSLSLIIGAYLTITLYLVWNVMPDEHMPLKKKLAMVGYAPVMYFIMYIMNVVQLVAVVRCIANYKQVLRRERATSVWVSPERSGQQVQLS